MSKIIQYIKVHTCQSCISCKNNSRKAKILANMGIISCRYCLFPYYITRDCCISSCLLCYQLHLAPPMYLVAMSVIPVFIIMVIRLNYIQVYISSWSILNVCIVFIFLSIISVFISIGCDAIYVSPESLSMLIGF